MHAAGSRCNSLSLDPPSEIALAGSPRRYAFFFDRQPFMKALRSSPFLPVACLEHVRILSCCETLPDAAGATTLIAAVWILAERGLTADVSSAVLSYEKI